MDECAPTLPDVSTDTLSQLLAVVQPLEQVAYLEVCIGEIIVGNMDTIVRIDGD